MNSYEFYLNKNQLHDIIPLKKKVILMLQKIIKDNYINLCIALVYTVIASLVYGIWSYAAWHLWYVTFIIVLVITIAGCIITYFWIKSEHQKKSDVVVKEEEKKEE